MKEILKFTGYPFIFLTSLIIYLITGKTLPSGYASFRYLFVKTNGKINDVCNKIISIFNKSYEIKEVDGVLGKLSESDISSIAKEIEINGYYVFNTGLNDELTNELYNFAKETRVSYLDFDQKHITYSKEKVLFNEDNPVSPRYQFNNEELFQNNTIKKLVFDKSLLAIANSYLKSKPILDLVVMWWSVPFDSKAENKAAQMYHFDMDRFKFLKFFFYLNDVGSDNGPHCYVRGSHKNLPEILLNDRRFTDNEIKPFYSEDDMLELTGKKGSIIAVDTRGLHKGKPLKSGKRLLFQLEYCNSLYGAPYNKIVSGQSDLFYADVKNKFSATFKLFE